MNELFDTQKIRDDQEHWNSLASRIARAAVTSERGRGGVIAFTGSWGAWAAATVLAGIAVGAMMIVRIEPGRGAVNEVNRAVQPVDNIGRGITASAGPPSIGALLLSAGPQGRVR